MEKIRTSGLDGEITVSSSEPAGYCRPQGASFPPWCLLPKYALVLTMVIPSLLGHESAIKITLAARSSCGAGVASARRVLHRGTGQRSIPLGCRELRLALLVFGHVGCAHLKCLQPLVSLRWLYPQNLLFFGRSKRFGGCVLYRF